MLLKDVSGYIKKTSINSVQKKSLIPSNLRPDLNVQAKPVNLYEPKAKRNL